MGSSPLVHTIPNKCRMCYTCVRECPAKAIKISDGQADILDERCIGCGNCILVCARGAKEPVGAVGDVSALLASGSRIAAILAPSFPAEFSEMSTEKLVGTLRALGFDYVCQVAFGADLVAGEYKKLLLENSDRRYIGVTCPAVVRYVEKYLPDIVENLAPIVSPMVAEAKVVRLYYGEETKVVFIGPCIAKRGEAEDDASNDVTSSITFAELRKLISVSGLDLDSVVPDGFDPPAPGLGALFPISRGMLQAAGLTEDLVSGDIVTADGRKGFVEALKEFSSGDMEARLLEVLCCEGCIMGAGMTSRTPIFNRRAEVSRYARNAIEKANVYEWNIALKKCSCLDLSRSFTPSSTTLPAPNEVEINRIMERMGKYSLEDELNCGACGYETCREHAIAVYEGLAESEMCLPFTIDQLKNTVEELAQTSDKLAGTQAALKHAERMADMGQLAAGVAHEVNNPLGVVLMFAHTLMEEHSENEDLKDDLETIAVHADRCKKIVTRLLDFARQNNVSRTLVNVPEMVKNTVAVIDRPSGIELEFINEDMELFAELDEDQIAQVLANLTTNAYRAMGNSGKLTVYCGGNADIVEIKFTDTGRGIPKENLKKIFEPFFTTWESGEGTGLGLAVSYGIVKMHRGQIAVESNADPASVPTGTTFTLTLPRRGPAS